MSITVIICTYNGEKYIEQQILSILQQERTPDEIILLDDNSKDTTFFKSRKLLEKSNGKIKIICEKNESNLGYVKNFEKAVLLAQNEIIVFSDQDDYWIPEKLTEIENVFNEKDIDLVFSDGDVVDSNLKSVGYTILDTKGITRKKRNDIQKGNLYRHLLKYNIVTGATIAVRKSFIKKILPFPQFWVHDAWISMIASENKRYHFIDKSLIKYRIHENNTVGTAKGLVGQYKNSKKENNTPEKNLHQITALAQYAENNFYLKGKKDINDKFAFLKSRATYSQHFFPRLLGVTLNTMRGNYHKFSNSYKSIFKDLFLYYRER